MSERVGVVWDDRLAEYDFGPGHPLAPIRVQLAMRLAAEFGLFAPAHVSILTPVEPVDDDAILRVHEPEYVRAVQAASSDPHFYDAARGLGTDDDPVFPGMHQASCRIAGASLTAARAVHSGEVEHAVNLAGGLHHALPGAAEGFCVYNDIAVAIAWLLDQGVERVAYLDVDVHHGDGVQAIFWNDPRVLTISIHESPRTLFPGTGFPTETGGPDAPGTAVNIAVPAGTNDQGWLRALHGVVPDVLAAFAPQVLVSQHGVDTHFEDPAGAPARLAGRPADGLRGRAPVGAQVRGRSMGRPRRRRLRVGGRRPARLDPPDRRGHRAPDRSARRGP